MHFSTTYYTHLIYREQLITRQEFNKDLIGIFVNETELSGLYLCNSANAAFTASLNTLDQENVSVENSFSFTKH